MRICFGFARQDHSGGSSGARQDYSGGSSGARQELARTTPETHQRVRRFVGGSPDALRDSPRTFSHENSLPKRLRSTYLLKNIKNNTFRTLKNLEKPRFFKVFLGFSRFQSFRVLNRFETIFPSKCCPGCHYDAPNITQEHPKVSQEVSWEAIGGC